MTNPRPEYAPRAPRRGTGRCPVCTRYTGNLKLHEPHCSPSARVASAPAGWHVLAASLAQSRALVRLAGRDSGVRYRVVRRDTVWRFGAEHPVVMIRPEWSGLGGAVTAVDLAHIVPVQADQPLL